MRCEPFGKKETPELCNSDWIMRQCRIPVELSTCLGEAGEAQRGSRRRRGDGTGEEVWSFAEVDETR